ncbi:MAG: hypothetical protein R6U21_01080 [Thermoplasmatota archaeon]
MAKSMRRRAACCGGGRVGKSIVRNASKSMEKKTVAQAKKLFENPFLVLPSFDDRDSKKAFKKSRKQLEKVEKIKDDITKLEKLSKKKNLAAAVAGTLLIAHAEKAPFLAAATLPTGQITYAQRGNASKEQLIAVQYVDDPFLRVLGIRDIALKNSLHIYSWDNGFVSTGKHPDPPVDFVSFAIRKANLSLNQSFACCSHLSEDILKNQQVIDQPYIHIVWKSAHVPFGICKQCASKKNTLFSMTKYLIEPEIADDFEVTVIGEIIKDTDESVRSSFFVDDYLMGKLSDDQLIEKNMRKRMENVKDMDKQLFVLDNVSYGDDRQRFIDALHPNEAEAFALSFILKRVDHPVVVSNATPNSVIELFWDDYAEELIGAIVDDSEAVEELCSLRETPAAIVETALTVKKRRKVLDQLPRYEYLPSLARFADHLCRVYKTRGKNRVLTELKSIPNETKAKALSFAFLLALGKAADKKWKFSKVEIESGEFLQPFVQKLLDASAEEYHEALQQVLSASGFSEDLSQYKI